MTTHNKNLFTGTKIPIGIVTAFLLTQNLAAQDLGTITVSSPAKTEQSIKDVTSDIEVLTSTELEEKHIATVSEALNLLDGIDVISNGGMGTTTSVFVRGFDSKRTLVLIDGIRYNDPICLNGAKNEHLKLDDVSKIEFIKRKQNDTC